MDYKKKSLKSLSLNESYEEIDTRLASGWYVSSFGNGKKKKYKTKEVSFTISKKPKNWNYLYFEIKILNIFECLDLKTVTILWKLYRRTLDFVCANTLF